MFVIKSDTGKLAEKIRRKKGNYILGKTVLQSPLRKIELRLDALPDHIGLSATIEGETKKHDIVTSTIENSLSARSYHAHTVQHITIGSDKETREPKVSVHQCKMPRTDSRDFLSMRLLFTPLDRIPSKSMGPSKDNDTTIPFTLSVLMGEDEEITLSRIPIDEHLENALNEFVLLCQTLVEAFYKAQSATSEEKQILSLHPVRLNDTEPHNDIFSSMFGGQSEGDKKKLEKEISIEKPTTTFANIGGLPKTISLIKRLVVALQNPAAYKKWGTRPPKGVLLYGEPGTGKTLVTKALANAVDASFYHVKITDILSMWHGKSEEHIDQVFKIAKESSPSIIFFDELDALGQDRNFGSEISSRLVAILLQNMDGIEQLERVIVVGATNRVENIDQALRRPGRFDRKIFVPMPDNESLGQILNIHIDLAEKEARTKLFQSIESSALIPKLEGMSGADVAEIVRRTLEEKAVADLDGSSPTLVTNADLEFEISHYGEHGDNEDQKMNGAEKRLLKDYLMMWYLANAARMRKN